MDEIVAFKNPAFEEEREWRIVARPRLVELQRAEEPKGTNESQVTQGTADDIQYRHSKGALVPYLKLSPIDNEKLPIRSIRLGPSLDKLQMEYALYAFLLKYGFSSARLFGSQMPVIL
jgi:hypothetical protein